MAKGKGSGKTSTSNGLRRSSAKTSVKDEGQRLLNQLAALRKGKNVVISIPNVSAKDGKVHPSTLVKINGKEFLNRAKNTQKGMKESVE